MHQASVVEPLGHALARLRRSTSRPEAIANPPHRLDRGCLRKSFQFGAQPGDVDIHCPRIDEEPAPPYAVDEFVAAEGLGHLLRPVPKGLQTLSGSVSARMLTLTSKRTRSMRSSPNIDYVGLVICFHEHASWEEALPLCLEVLLLRIAII